MSETKRKLPPAELPLNFEFSEGQRAIWTAVTQLMKDFPDEYWEKMDANHEFPWAFYKAFVEGGFLGVTIPEQYGGSGLGLI